MGAFFTNVQLLASEDFVLEKLEEHSNQLAEDSRTGPLVVSDAEALIDSLGHGALVVAHGEDFQA